MSILERTRKVHFIGVGGVGMSGIAELLLGLGHKVTGSDLSDASESVTRLRSLGATVQKGHDAKILETHAPDVVVYSTAVAKDNPELVYARARRVPIIRRAEMLAEIMRLKRGLAVAGSHGKTTTTGMVSLVLKRAGLEPTVAVGGRFDALGSNAALGQGAWMVAEADESDGSFLRLAPEIAIVTNVDPEHLDHWGTFEKVLEGFAEFLDRLPFYGRAVLCSDCPNLRLLAERLQKPALWYGFEAAHGPDVLVELLEEGAHPRFRLHRLSREGGQRKPWIEVRLSVPGRHNVLNATAAALAASELGIADDKISSALGEFTGVARRFEKRGEWKGHPVIEDYAHHPTEIRATLAAARAVFPSTPPIVLFQPHRYTRTRDQWREFSACFEGAGEVLTLPIYAASEPREAWAEALDGAGFAANVQGPPALACASQDALLAALADGAVSGRWKAGAPVLVLGAGDISKIIPRLLAGKA
jgi:UDP-N-acetylmuramate--alanine ligase